MDFAAPLSLGTSKVDITPPFPVSLAGYAWRKGNADGVSRRLYAMFFYFRQPTKERAYEHALLVSADLICWGSDLVESLRPILQDRFGLSPSSVILHATHTHSGPQTSKRLSESIGSCDDRYLQFLESALIRGIEEAIASLEEVEVESGRGSCDFNINRRKFVDGRIVGAPNPKGPVDQEVLVYRFLASGKRPKAIWVHYTCHPTITDQNRISSEFPGAAMEMLENSFQGEPVVAYLQGCCGDVRPALVRDGAFFRGDDLTITELGARLAEETLAILGERMSPLSQTVMICRHKEVPLELEKLPGGEPTQVPFDITMVRLASELYLLAMNGEMVVEYGLKLKEAYAGKVLPLAYSNGMLGYIPTGRQTVEGGYEGRDAYVYFGLPSPFTSLVEASVLQAVTTLLEEFDLG